MGTKDWKPASRSSWITSWNKYSDYSKPKYRNMKNPTAFCYLYNKGKFRGAGEMYVVSTSKTGGGNPKDRKNIKFKTKSEALKYAKAWRGRN